MPVPSPPRKLLIALQRELADADITRIPGVAGAEPPLWVEPADGAPEPGTKSGVEGDPNTALALFHSGGVVGQGWERQITVDFWIRTKGNAPMLRAMDLDERIRDQLLPHPVLVDGQRMNFKLAAGTADELLVIACAQWRELQRLGSSAGQGYTDVVSYWFQLYRMVP